MDRPIPCAPSQRDETELAVNIGPNIALELERRAEASGVSVDDMVRRALLEWIALAPSISPQWSGMMRLDATKRRAVIDGRTVHLSPLEMKVLAALLRRPGEMVSVDQIKEVVWGPDADTCNRTLAVHICRLREKLGPSAQIRALRRQGYWLELSPSHDPQTAKN